MDVRWVHKSKAGSRAQKGLFVGGGEHQAPEKQGCHPDSGLRQIWGSGVTESRSGGYCAGT